MLMASFAFREVLLARARGAIAIQRFAWKPEENTQALRRSDSPDAGNRGVLVVAAACSVAIR